MPAVSIIGTRGYPSFYGGFETAVRRLAPYLADRGWDVTVYGRPDSTVSADADPRIERVVTRGIESRSASTLTYGLTACVSAARRRPDVALVMNVANGYFLPLLSVRGIPAVVNVDGIEWERQKWGSAARRVFKAGAKLTARWADELVVDAEAIGDRWLADFGRTGRFIPYGGVREEPLSVPLGLTSGDYALVVARFVPENTIPEFLVAAETLASKHDVVIVGSSGYGGDLDIAAQNLADRNPRVHALGHIRDDRVLHALWQHAGAYFHGHSVGGTNPALVQAMACGAAVVARDTPYNREVLDDAGVFVEGTPEAIAQGMLGLLGDAEKQAELSRRAMMRVESNYTWDLVCERYEAALHDVIASRAARSRRR